jgi:ribosomal protein S27E
MTVDYTCPGCKDSLCYFPDSTHTTCPNCGRTIPSRVRREATKETPQ